MDDIVFPIVSKDSKQKPKRSADIQTHNLLPENTMDYKQASFAGHIDDDRNYNTTPAGNSSGSENFNILGDEAWLTLEFLPDRSNQNWRKVIL